MEVTKDLKTGVAEVKFIFKKGNNTLVLSFYKWPTMSECSIWSFVYHKDFPSDNDNPCQYTPSGYCSSSDLDYSEDFKHNLGMEYNLKRIKESLARVDVLITKENYQEIITALNWLNSTLVP